jgi:hypothetical protein
MSFVSNQERAIISNLMSNRISEDDFRRTFPRERGDASPLGLAMLRRASRERDAIGAELGLYLIHRFGIPHDCLPVLIELAAADWHERHEDVVDALKSINSPDSIDVLYMCAISNYSYRDYDDAYSLGTKCIYALAKVETYAALARIGQLSRCGNEILEREADRQLARLASVGKTENIRKYAQEM